ncbi:MAG: IgGFc-binding protein [Myxococcota bacterium]
MQPQPGPSRVTAALVAFAFGGACRDASTTTQAGDAAEGGPDIAPARVCEPGTTICGGPFLSDVLRCNEQGTAQERIAECDASAPCKDGLCVSPCSHDIKQNSNVGCGYYAVDLQNGDVAAGAPDSAPFAVIVSNPHDHAMQVAVEGLGDDQTVQVEPSGLATIVLGQADVFGTTRGAKAWHLSGNLPFVAYQFNPLDNVGVFSNDASLLFPVSDLGREYIAVTGQQAGFVTIVAAYDGTSVTVTPTAAIRAGDDVPPLPAGEPWSTTLVAGELLNLDSEGVLDRNPEHRDGDLTGTIVSATQPIVVFSGSRAARTSDRCCADHLEHQLVAVSQWGAEVVAGRSAPRGYAPDYWRIVAAEDETRVRFEPQVHVPVSLARGEMLEVVSRSDFVIESDKPIEVVQLLASSFEATTFGRMCEQAEDCPESHDCELGLCVPRCQPQRATCAAGFECRVLPPSPFSFIDLAPGEGQCVQLYCRPDGPPCDYPTSCVAVYNGIGICSRDCSYPYGACGSGLECGFGDGETGACEPRSCLDDDSCLDDRFVCGEDGCTQKCQPPPGLCDDLGYTCETGISELSTCVAPSCDDDSQCPAGHMCGHFSHACETIGDPAMWLVSPAEQFRDRYVFLVPSGYVHDYVNLVAKPGTEVQLDGRPLAPTWRDVGGFRVATVEVDAGVHRLVATQPVGASVYGFDDDVSYGYAAGMNLDER